MKICQREREATVPAKIEIISMEVQKGKVKKCMFYWIANKSLIVEWMIKSIYLEEKQMDSSTISNFENSQILVVGDDRGGGDLISITRHGNFKGGNTGYHSTPLGVVEDAAKTRENLEKTV
jgi:hypothetical protein